MILPYEIIIIAAAALPCAVFVFLIDRYDRFKKEPRRLLLKLFAAGLVTPLAASFLEHMIFPLCAFAAPPLLIPVQAFLGVALPEEGVKLLAMLIILRRRKEFDELLDGPVYGIITAMAFALVENILYVFGTGEPLSTAILRGLTAVPLHALAGGILGLGAAMSRVENKRTAVWGGFLMAVILHGAYDWFLMDPRFPGLLSLPLLVFGWVILARRIRRARQQDVLSGRHAPDPPPFSPFG